MTPEAKSNIAGRPARIAMTPACNIHCVYCEGTAGFRAGKPGAMEDFRKSPLEAGIIPADKLVTIIDTLHQVGFGGVTLTGGEPTLSPHWDFIIQESNRIGMQKAELTTNGTTLNRYLDRKGELPRALSLVKISLDTPDPELFTHVRGGAKLPEIISGIKRIKDGVRIRANKVILRSDLEKLDGYFEFIQGLGIKELLLLDLVFHPNRDSEKDARFFEQEYVPVEDLMASLNRTHGMEFTGDRYGHKTQFGDLKIILKDSNLTLRNDICETCPVYCQEGLYTMRIATDGNITLCPDFKGELPSVNAVQAIEDGTLKPQLEKLVNILETAHEEETLEKFMAVHSLSLAQGDISTQ